LQPKLVFEMGRRGSSDETPAMKVYHDVLCVAVAEPVAFCTVLEANGVRGPVVRFCDAEVGFVGCWGELLALGDGEGVYDFAEECVGNGAAISGGTIVAAERGGDEGGGDGECDIHEDRYEADVRDLVIFETSCDVVVVVFHLAIFMQVVT